MQRSAEASRCPDGDPGRQRAHRLGFGDFRQPKKCVYAQVIITSHLRGFKTPTDKAWSLKMEKKWVRDRDT